MIDDDFEKSIGKLRIEQVTKAIRENPKNWSSKLEELGFQWFDDEYDLEEEEEKEAKPENSNQDLLVAYFEGTVDLSDQVLDSFHAERESENPNYPLIRKYFKTGNENLKKMLVLGLEKNPTDIGLINDLSYFHEFNNLLGELIQFYLRACENENDLSNFEELVQDFILYTRPDDFDALYELEQRYDPESSKGKILWRIKEELIHQSDTVIEF